MNVATSTQRRVGPVRAVRHALTLTWRSLLKIRYSPEQIGDLTFQPIIFIVLFVYLFGTAVAGDPHAYLQFVLPGIMVQTIVFASMGTGIGLNTDITTGIFDRFRSLPIARSAPLMGAVLGDVVRYAFSLMVVLLFGMALGFRVHAGVPQVLAGLGLVMLFALALCWIPALVGVLVKRPQSVQAIGFTVMFPLTFGSNIFVPVGKLPGWLQAWVRVNPISQLSSAVRALLLGGPTAGPVLHSLLWTIAIAVVFAPLAVRAYLRRT